MEATEANENKENRGKNYEEELSSEISFPTSGYNDNITVNNEKYSKLIDYYESKL